jgi:hypothetical protein
MHEHPRVICEVYPRRTTYIYSNEKVSNLMGTIAERTGAYLTPAETETGGKIIGEHWGLPRSYTKSP